MNQRLNIICCVEQGILEQQAILLAKSVRHWLRDLDVVVHAYSPRPSQWPSQPCLTAMQDLNVIWHKDELNTDFHDYPIANKVLACRHFEQTFTDQSSVMFVDTDTVFLKSIDASLLNQPQSLFVRPVDNKGPGSESDEDPNDAFWQAVFSLCHVEVPEARIQTTVRPATIRNYFNAGLIWSHHLPGFFQQWYTDFMTIVDSKLRPFGYQSRDGDDFRCLDQVALAVTATRWAEQLNVLPPSYNYPIPFKPVLQERPGHPGLDDLVHVHYHKWFQHPGFLSHVIDDQERSMPAYQWLEQQLPLSPTIDGPFKC